MGTDVPHIKSNSAFTTVKSSIKLLDEGTRKKYYLTAVLQVLLSFLDFFSVALVGVIGALTVRGVQSQSPGDKIEKVLKVFRLDNLSFQMQVSILAVLVVLLLVLKTIASIYISRRTLIFLANQSAFIGGKFARKILSQPLSRIYSRGEHELHYVLGPGISGIVLGILGIASSIIADASLLIVLAVGLALLSPLIAISSLLFFGLIAIALHFLLRNHASDVGTRILHSEVKANQLITESLDLYRELYVRNSRSKYAQSISDLRKTSSIAQAEQLFLPNISKYVLEISVIVGSVLIAGIQFVTETAAVAVASLGLFLIAGGRIAPALMRLQQSILSIETRITPATSTLETLNVFGAFEEPSNLQSGKLRDHSGFKAEIQLSNINFEFDAEHKLFEDLNLRVNAGTMVAIVGPSGGGKTTLVNLMLGLTLPTSGSALISGCAPELAVSKWPGAIAYVPQDVRLISGTIRANIEIGLTDEESDASALQSAINRSHLAEFIQSLPEGVETLIGETGLQLSGGQKQRLGLARAFYTNPLLIILDEATSALDGETEENIAVSLRNLRGETTLIIIAHRLSTVQDADVVIYLESGNILAQGNFEEVRKLVPGFDRQANLIGL